MRYTPCLFLNYDLNARLRGVRSKSARTELLERFISVIRISLWYWMSDTLHFASNFSYVLLLVSSSWLPSWVKYGADMAPLCFWTILKVTAVLLDSKVIICDTN